MFIDCSKYAGKCACGREHTMETRAAVIEPGCLFEFEKYMAQFGVTGKRCALYGENSYAATADRHPRAEQQIVLDPTGLHANEISTAEVLAKLEGDVEVIVAVGSGTALEVYSVIDGSGAAYALSPARQVRAWTASAAPSLQ